MEEGKGTSNSEKQTNAASVEVKKPVEEASNNDEQTNAASVEVKKPVEEASNNECDAKLLTNVKNQIEFYFGDVNLQRDKFLKDQINLDEGWIPISVLLKFKMLANMTMDPAIIIKALETSDLMEVSEDQKKIRRSPNHPLPVYDEAYRQNQDKRTVYAKGFPLLDTNIPKLKTFFEPHGPIENVLMRKYQDKEKKLCFKGSIYVQFQTLELAKAFMALESVKYQDTELIRMWLSDYYALKTAEKAERRRPMKSENKEKKAGDKDTGAADIGNDGEDADKEKEEIVLPKGSVIHLSGLSEETSKDDIKTSLGKLEASVAYVDHNKGDAESWARLQGENAARPIVEKMTDQKLMISGKEVVCRILEGEEEDKYLAKAKGDIANNLRNRLNNKGRRGGKRGGRGSHRGGGRKRRNNSPHRGTQSPAKKAAIE